MCTSARSKASSDVSGGGKNEAPGTCAQPAHAAHAIQNFQYYAGPTGHIAFWNESPKLLPNQRKPGELQKADGLAAIQEIYLSINDGSNTLERQVVYSGMPDQSSESAEG